MAIKKYGRIEITEECVNFSNFSFEPPYKTGFPLDEARGWAIERLKGAIYESPFVNSRLYALARNSTNWDDDRTEVRRHIQAMIGSIVRWHRNDAGRGWLEDGEHIIGGSKERKIIYFRHPHEKGT